MKPNDSLEVTVLEERRRALQTLIRYERDLDKLKVSKYELDLVTTELQRIEEALYRRPNGKIIPFPPKNHVRALISRVFRRQHPSWDHLSVPFSLPAPRRRGGDSLVGHVARGVSVRDRSPILLYSIEKKRG